VPLFNYKSICQPSSLCSFFFLTFVHNILPLIGRLTDAFIPDPPDFVVWRFFVLEDNVTLLTNGQLGLVIKTLNTAALNTVTETPEGSSFW
jgi:hypothetical protein